MHNSPRVMIAAPGSGQGKTTMTCALLQAFQDRGDTPAAFKCGPDYIDPMFHREILGLPSRNLDLFLAGEALVRDSLSRHSAGHGISVIEGVMGFYDGLGGTTDRAGSWHLADTTKTPVLLVLQPKGMSLTLAAIVNGLLHFRENSRIAGLLLNRCTPHLYAVLAPMLERETGLPVLGYLPPMPEIELPSRHLGLVLAHEQEQLREKMALLARQAAKTITLDRILEIASAAPPLPNPPPPPEPVVDGVSVAVVVDEAFCFYYPDNLDLLEALGARLLPFSPLRDKELPQEAAALYLGGGYPELHAKALSENRSMRESIRNAISRGLPTIAECGGFLYLHKELEAEDGRYYPMAEVLPARAFRTGRLQRFGYATLTALEDGLLAKGSSIPVHEFHYWDSEAPGEACLTEKPISNRQWRSMINNSKLLAGFPHLYFPTAMPMIKEFLRLAQQYSEAII